MSDNKKSKSLTKIATVAFATTTMAAATLLAAVNEMDKRLEAENIKLSRTEAVKLLVQGPPSMSSPFSLDCLNYMDADGKQIAGAPPKPDDLNCNALTSYAEKHDNYQKLKRAFKI